MSSRQETARRDARTAGETANNGPAHGAPAGCVRIALAFDAALAAVACALAVAWGFVLPAAGCLAAFAVSAWTLNGLKGGAR